MARLFFLSLVDLALTQIPGDPSHSFLFLNHLVLRLHQSSLVILDLTSRY